MKNNTFVSTVYKDEDDELFIVIPEEILQQLNWVENDIVEWSVEDNKVTITKIYSYSKEG